MSKRERLTRADFALVERAKSRRVHGTYFSLLISQLPGDRRGPRFACVVSKKVSPKATQRNRINRRCRESVRPLLRKVNATVALIFRARKEAASATFADINRDLYSLVEKLADTGHTP